MKKEPILRFKFLHQYLDGKKYHYTQHPFKNAVGYIFLIPNLHG